MLMLDSNDSPANDPHYKSLRKIPHRLRRICGLMQ
jgi:hypothetical protein